jgi:hypothetical protein
MARLSNRQPPVLAGGEEARTEVAAGFCHLEALT